MSTLYDSESFQRVGQYTIYVRESDKSKSRTLLLVHGIGVSGRYFHRFAQVAAHEYNVIVIDLPGYGKTPKPPYPLSIDQLARVVADYVTQANVLHVTIIGQSMGSQIAAHAVQKYPLLFQNLILLGPTTNKDERSIVWQGLRLMQDTLREPLKANIIIFSDYFRMGVLRYFRTAQYMVDDRLDDTLQACYVPTLVARGEKDVIAPSEWIEYLCRKSPNAIISTVKDAPHVAQYTHPEELLAICNTFIKQ